MRKSANVTKRSRACEMERSAIEWIRDQDSALPVPRGCPILDDETGPLVRGNVGMENLVIPDTRVALVSLSLSLVRAEIQRILGSAARMLANDRGSRRGLKRIRFTGWQTCTHWSSRPSSGFCYWRSRRNIRRPATRRSAPVSWASACSRKAASATWSPVPAARNVSRVWVTCTTNAVLA